MEFIKNHLISLISGVLGLTFVVIAVMGMTSDKVVQDMSARVQEAGEIKTLQSDPQNESTIKAEQEHGEQLNREFDKALSKAEQFNRREPLVKEGVFPKTAQPHLRFAFAEAYGNAIRQMYSDLNAGDTPDEQDKADAREEIEAIKAAKKEANAEGGGAAPGVPAPAPGLPVAPPMSSGRGGISARGGTVGLPGPSTEMQNADPNENAELRAMVRKARSIRCYVGGGNYRDLNKATLHVSPIVDANTPPSIDQMWYAQVSYWIQADFVKCVKQLNDDAAKQLPDNQRNVEHMPVKRIDYFRVFGYLLPSMAIVEFPTKTNIGPAIGSTQEASFTNRTSDPNTDVVRFEFSVVMDQRDILKLVDAMSKQNFYQLIGLEYTGIDDRNDRNAGFLYGSSPAVRVKFKYEALFSRKVYGELMPEVVKESLSGPKPL